MAAPLSPVLARTCACVLFVLLLVPAAAWAGWSAPAAISVGSGAVSGVDASISESGVGFLVWRESAESALIKGRTVAADGTLGAILTLSAAGGDSTEPQVAVDSAGTAHVVWLRSDGNNDRAQIARVKDGAVSTVQDLSASGQDATEPQVAVDGTGAAYAVWRRMGATNQVIQGRRLSPLLELGNTDELSDATQDAERPRLSVNAAGQVAVVWQYAAAIEGRRIAAGGALGARTELAATGEKADVHVASDGTASACWLIRVDVTQRIPACRHFGANDSLTNVTDLASAGTLDALSVAGNASGSTLVTWIASGDPATAFVRRFRADPSLGSTLTVALDAGSSGVRPSMASDGAVLLVWRQSAGGVAARILNGSDSLGDTTQVSVAGQVGEAPAAAYSVPAGLVLWHVPGATQTQLARYTPPPAPSTCPVGTSSGVTCATDSSGTTTISGTSGDDVIRGTGGNDVIDGGGGNDHVVGGAGSDRLSGGEGDDIIDGGDGTDTLEGEEGSDALFGAGGNDSLKGGAGSDALDAGAGADTLSGGAGADGLFGRNGSDRLSGGSGNDRTIGGRGNDAVLGNTGADVLLGGSGNDRILGGAGPDRLEGGTGDDRLFGRLGADVLFGQSGDDLLRGGSGYDLLDGGGGTNVLDQGAA